MKRISRAEWTAAWREVSAEEFAIWLQAARTMIAMLLALAIAFRLDLSSPSSAAITVAIVSLPQTGMVMEKSFYRLLATLFGGLVTLLLVAVFAQQRDLFIFMVALWVGICAALSAWFRNFRSYGWALAGYTACMIGFPAYEHAEHAFDIVVDRVSIVALGIFCGAVVNTALFPRTSAQSLVQAVRRSFRDFTAFVDSTLAGQSRGERHAIQRQFLQDVVALESIRAASFFEDPETRARTPRLRRFISQFMVSSTTAHAINRLRDDLRARGMETVLAALESLNAVFSQALRIEGGRHATAAAEAVAVVEQLAGLRAQWPDHAQAAREQLARDGASREEIIELESALITLREFIDEARDFAETYAELRAPRSALDRLGGEAPVVRADRITAAIAGLRAMCALIAVSAFWIASSWPDGFSAALLAAVACALFVNAPAPAQAVWQMVKGFLAGLLAGIVCYTFVLPALDGMLLLVAGLVPFLMIGTYLMARPATAGIGSGYCIMFLVSLGLSATMQYDITALLNGGLSQVVGVIFAALAFDVLFPTNTAWHARRIEKTLWSELQIAARAPLADLRHRFESGVRDLSLQYLNLAPGAGERQRRMIAGMILLEAGRAVIALRELKQDSALRDFSATIDNALDAAVRALTATPNAAAIALYERAGQNLDALSREVEAVLPIPAPLPLITLRTALQLLQLALGERKLQLAPSASNTLEEGGENAARN